MANESEGKRGLSHSERDCGDAKLWRRLFLLWLDDDNDEVAVWDIAGILRKRRGLRGKERKGQLVVVVVVVLWDLEEVKRKQTESAVSKRSGKEGRLDIVSGCRGGDISNEVVVVFWVEVVVDFVMGC